MNAELPPQLSLVVTADHVSVNIPLKPFHQLDELPRRRQLLSSLLEIFNGEMVLTLCLSGWAAPAPQEKYNDKNKNIMN